MSTFQTIATTAYASRTNTTVNAPTGVADGDRLLLFLVLGAATPPTPTLPAGFSLIPAPSGQSWPLSVGEAGFNLALRVAEKTASSEGSSYTITHTAASSFAAMVRVSGADATPFDPVPTVVLHPGGVVVNDTVVPSLTTAADGSLLIVFGWDWADTANNLTPPTGTTPTFTERFDGTIAYMASGNLATAGATGSKTFANNANGASPFGGLMIAMKPTAGGGTNVTAPAAAASGDVPTPAVAAASTATAPAASGVGDAAIPAVTAGSTVPSPVASATGDLITPAVSGSPVPSGPPPTTNQDTGSGYGIAQQYQRGTFTAGGLHWLFYADDIGSDVQILYVTSADDGATWSDPTTVRSLGSSWAGGTRGFDVHYDGSHVHTVTGISGPGDLIYARGTISSGSISWGADQTVKSTGTAAWEVSVSTDSAGRPWVAWEDWTGGAAVPMVSGSTSTDGTWVERAGHPFTLSDSSTAPFVDLCWTYIGRLNGSGHMICFFWYEADVYARVWDGTAWAAYEGPIDTPSHDNVGETIAFVTDPGNGVAHAVWGDSSTGIYHARRSNGGTWTQDQVTTDLASAMALGFDAPNGDVHLLHLTGQQVLHTIRAPGGSWSLQGDVLDVSGDSLAIVPISLQIAEYSRSLRIVAQCQVYDPAAPLDRDQIQPLVIATAANGNASVTAPAATATGDLPTPTVTGQAGATVTAPPASSSGDLVTPAVAAGSAPTAPPASAAGDLLAPAVSSGRAVTAPPALATGALPPTNNLLSAAVTVPSWTVTGQIPAPSVSGTGSVTVTAPPAAATGDQITPTVSAGAAIVSPAATGTGTIPAPAVGGTNSATVNTPAAQATANIPTPAVAAEQNATVTAPRAFATGTMPPVAYQAGGSAAVPAPLMFAVCTMLTPAARADVALLAPALAAVGLIAPVTVQSVAGVLAPAMLATGSIPAPGYTASITAVAPPAAATGRIPPPVATGTVITVMPPPMTAYGTFPAPSVRAVFVYSPTDPGGRIAQSRTGHVELEGVT